MPKSPITSGPFKFVVTVDERFLLFALDRLYRKAMQAFERTTLLAAARRVASVLDIVESDEPVEGYYSTELALTEYFRLMRALQQVSESRETEVARLPEFQRLWSVASSPIYGSATRSEKLLPTGLDALSQALKHTEPWTLERLLPAARMAALEGDDCSLVGLAARVEDAVALTALRESVVLYASVIKLGLPPPPTFEWKVDSAFAAHANRFVDAFNALVPSALPTVAPENVDLFYDPHVRFWDVEGRCVRIGVDPFSIERRHYHWAICSAGDGELTVEEFWSTEIWTTERYLAERP
jgi:hypothetical protein